MRLYLAAQNADAVELRSLREQYSDALRLNVHRSALQLLGCSGKIVGQFVVPRYLMQALEAEK